MNTQTQLAAAVFIVASAPNLKSQPFINGGFEDPIVSETIMAVVFDSAGDRGVVPGWSFGGNPDSLVGLLHGVVAPFPGMAPSEGDQYLQFNGNNQDPGAWAAQRFSTEVGVSYRLAFRAGRAQAADDSTGEVGVRAEVLSSSDLLLDSLEVFPQAVGYLSPSHLLFQAVSDETVIRFTDISPTTYSLDLLIDAVQLDVDVGAVPEAGTACVAGIVAFGIVTRVCRAKARACHRNPGVPCG